MRYPILTTVATGMLLLTSFNLYWGYQRAKRHQNTFDREIQALNATYAGDNEIVGYTLTKRRGIADLEPTFAVVIGDVDPRKKDYKTICKAIVSDIAHNYRLEHLDVVIYDSTEAFNLFENQYLSQFQLLSKVEMGIVEEHVVATFRSGSNPEEHVIRYYEYANGSLNEEESFVL